MYSHKRLQQNTDGFETPLEFLIFLGCLSVQSTCFLPSSQTEHPLLEKSWYSTVYEFCFSYSPFSQLNSKNMTEFGPVDDHADSGDEATYNSIRLPGAKRGDDGSRSSKVEVLTLQVAFSSTGREWAAVSGEGLHVYSLDEDMLFDPISLTEAITPAAVETQLEEGCYSMALRMAIHLNEFALVQQVLEEIPYASISSVARTIGPEQLERLMNVVAKVMETSPHIQYYLQWCLELLQTHGMYMDQHRSSFLRAFRAMHMIVQTRHDELRTICNENRYMLDFIEDQGRLTLARNSSADGTTTIMLP
jgi:periodic tryptophan protein 2